MERVAFLIEETNERLSCLLNPETLVMRRLEKKVELAEQEEA